MSIVRRKRTENFTIVPNHIWDDEYISFEAKSLLAYLLSRPDNWKVNAKHLQKVMGFGRDKTQKIVTSLVERGYIERRAIQGDDGLFAGQELVVFDEIDRELPDNYGMPENQSDRDGVPENGEPENPCDGKSGTLIRTDKITSTDNICSFEEFWDAFNHKKGKEAALKVWRRKKLNLKSDEVIRGAKAYVKNRGDNPQYWKHAQGWLNDGRWEDFQPSQPSQSPQIDWEKRLKVYTENNIWLPDWGSEPGLEGCRVPASLLKPLEAQNA